ncbi:hypothetical protein TRFO_08599 [Tritrichomonas foetus]|uniref:Uncharacterized protein n=1 Tax=Tritrichomonas foetus TaxID=1144522 RepID=A0A1J4JNC7_9EUKA|nr:hypothetical protein TRFO_08599 [Tritrichomonas foetus]|eukprot:OHS99043.1 hypothetical protein TRFO_08599 [Tritrichomonas foetus]
MYNLPFNFSIFRFMKQITENENPSSFITNNLDSLTCEHIPALAFLSFSNDESERQISSNALIKIVKETEFNNTDIIIEPEQISGNKEKSKQLNSRIVILKPTNLNIMTYPFLEYSLHIFISLIDKFGEETRNDALNLFEKLFSNPNFIPTKQIMLDMTNFLLLFLRSENETKSKSYELLNKICEIAENRCDVEVTIAAKSIFHLFPK